MIRWFSALAFDWCLIVAAMWGFDHLVDVNNLILSFLTGLAAVLLIGTRQHGISVLAHDGAHNSITKNRNLNDALARLCFLPFGISLARYREFHFAHHRFVGTERDPERWLKAMAAPAWDMPGEKERERTGLEYRLQLKVPWFSSKAARRSHAIQCYRACPSTPPLTASNVPQGTLTRHILLLCARDFLVWPALRESLPFMAQVLGHVETCVAITLWALSVVLFGWWPVLLWFAALSTSFWASNRLRVWTEHQGTDGTHCVRMTWWQRFLFAPHGIGWHAEHHQIPSLPFYRLMRIKRPKAVSVGELFAGYGR